jgi:hypothetical protein
MRRVVQAEHVRVQEGQGRGRAHDEDADAGREREPRREDLVQRLPLAGRPQAGDESLERRPDAEIQQREGVDDRSGEDPESIVQVAEPMDEDRDQEDRGSRRCCGSSSRGLHRSRLARSSQNRLARITWLMKSP